MGLATRLSRCRLSPRCLGVGALMACAVLATNVWCTQRAVPPTTGTDSPTLSAVLVALGGCRGIISEVLWWRISDLQRQNRYAELVPLTDLLVTLDPASADTWVYNAWNLAYNISAAHQEPAERWRWVKRGVALLERGLRATPRATPILRQLGWICEDKLAGTSDAAASYYRAHLKELPIPDDADAFATQVGVTPDWNDPLVRAAYWYSRAENPRDQLRVLMRLIGARGRTDWIPFLLHSARLAWPDLAPRQQAQVATFLRQLQSMTPQAQEIESFLEEVTP